MSQSSSIYIGFDSREAVAFAVARASVKRHLTQPAVIRGLVLSELQNYGLYKRPMELRTGWKTKTGGGPIMWDMISDAPMSTEFACSRFLVPHIAGRGWALFCDCDMLFRANVARLFENLDKQYAVYCVKHNYQSKHAQKMDGQIQTRYNRKLWSSFCIFNCDHPSNAALTLDMINSLPGRDLHAFCWLKDDEIGDLGEEWNWIYQHSPDDLDPKCVHFTEGLPYIPGYENHPYASEWRRELEMWAGGI